MICLKRREGGDLVLGLDALDLCFKRGERHSMIDTLLGKRRSLLLSFR